VTSTFYKSTFSGANQSCVEVCHQEDSVLIRDSKYNGPADRRPIVKIPAEIWPHFLSAALGGSSARITDEVLLRVHDDGSATISAPNNTLSYTQDEWDAFMKGIANEEF
jgi:hypothetical protein